MKLIPNASKAWRMLSVQAMTLASAILGAWPSVPDDLKARLPAHWVNYICAAVLVCGIVGRLVQQPSLTPPDTDQKP